MQRRQKKYKSLGVSVNPKYWNFERNTLKPNCPNYEYLSKPIADTQINAVAKAYISDKNFGSYGSDIDMWKFYNLLTGANKISYIDSFLDHSFNAAEVAHGINAALHGDDRYSWFID